MTEIDPLVLDLLEWVGPTGRPYSEVIEAWRTSCPRLTVWEDANELGLVERRREAGVGELICVSESGHRHLRAHRGEVHLGAPWSPPAPNGAAAT